MRFQREIVNVWDAQKRLEHWIRPLGTEKVKLAVSIKNFLNKGSGVRILLAILFCNKHY
ncbi:hypothetical protein PB1_11304 [Bacillus methanolicus PB1]|uniref:Uncharacterized protein n=1 Tax=Bacillus methanolicus PB1 TaxID=997296 RepID=I3DV72_BACMT|nr:hypothetical protein [Bacillus methanolicus]EIJ78143.1 hypothetical protein PB1_11304 [Bacillus methanolicus PB1]